MAPTDDPTAAPLRETTPTPEEEFALAAQIDRVEAEKQAARDAPDIPWGKWWFESGSKWYVALGFLILDVWLFSIGYSLGSALAIVGFLVAALYGEFLLYRFLYYVPSPDDLPPKGPFRPTWARPVEYGRWTEEGAARRLGGPVARAEQGPDPKEFL